DGRYNLLVRGVARAAIGAELPPDRPYREVHAFLPPEIPATSLELVETIRRCVLDISQSLNPAVAGPLLTALAHADDPSTLCDMVGATLIIEPDARQRVLEATDVQKRLDIVVGELGGVLLKLRAVAGDGGFEFMM
ncbi:MAG: LON peptidase substrate-binding domain-containing protein, partial [Myxococcales bacterium]